jgi:Co/Zn/Cd efflux system component
MMYMSEYSRWYWRDVIVIEAGDMSICWYKKRWVIVDPLRSVCVNILQFSTSHPVSQLRFLYRSPKSKANSYQAQNACIEYPPLQ